MKARDARRRQIAEELVKDIKAEIPDELVEMEFEKMSAELADSLAKMSLSLENYLAHLKKTPDELKKEWRPQADKRVKVALSLKEIAKKEKIETSDAEVEDKLSQILRSSPPLSPGQNLDLTALRGYVRSIIRNEKVFELLENN